MSKKVWDWLTSRKKKMEEYEETKKDFEKVLGKPSITVTLELPEDLKEQKAKFLSLEKDEKFLKDMEKLMRKHMKKKTKSTKQSK